jgi:hypothetical protein
MGRADWPGFVLVALLVWAIQVWRKGLKITGNKTMTGTPAKILAVVLALLALAVCCYAFLVWPGIPR